MPEMLRVLIVDDEALARRGLEIRLQNEPGITVCGQSNNGRQAIADVARLKPDIVFLDVQMPGIDGFATLQQLAGPHMPIVIFVTAHADYAIRAFEANALDYLLKPIDDQRLQASVERARERINNQAAAEHRKRLLRLVCEITGQSLTLDDALNKGEYTTARPPQRLAIKDGQTIRCVDLDDIDWIEAAGDYLCIRAADTTHVMRGTMKKMEQLLNAEYFARIHRSTIINIRRVVSLHAHINGEYFVELAQGRTFKLSRTYRDCVPKLISESPYGD